jgi:hypothetical protein
MKTSSAVEFYRDEKKKLRVKIFGLKKFIKLNVIQTSKSKRPNVESFACLKAFSSFANAQTFSSGDIHFERICHVQAKQRAFIHPLSAVHCGEQQKSVHDFTALHMSIYHNTFLFPNLKFR